jgi:hypothetical protein
MEMASWFSLDRRTPRRRWRQKLLTPAGWYGLLAIMAIAAGAAIGIVK